MIGFLKTEETFLPHTDNKIFRIKPIYQRKKKQASHDWSKNENKQLSKSTPILIKF